MYLLDRHPGVRDRLFEEIDAVLGNRRITVDDLDAMPYTDQVIQETMRLYPSVYLTIREADREMTAGDVTIPKGARLVVNIRGLHLDPAAWEAPERFDPDRFEAGSGEGRHRFQHIPFLAGPKKCLGDHFAMMEMRLAIPTLLQRLRFSYDGERVPSPEAGFTLSVDNGMPMQAHRR